MRENCTVGRWNYVIKKQPSMTRCPSSPHIWPIFSTQQEDNVPCNNSNDSQNSSKGATTEAVDIAMYELNKNKGQLHGMPNKYQSHGRSSNNKLENALVGIGVKKTCDHISRTIFPYFVSSFKLHQENTQYSQWRWVRYISAQEKGKNQGMNKFQILITWKKIILATPYNFPGVFLRLQVINDLQELYPRDSNFWQRNPPRRWN